MTDGVFGLSGDIAPLPEIVAIAERHGADVVVDDAHGSGVLGHGRGTVAHFGLEGRVGRARFQDLALEVLNIAMTGLARQHALNERGDDESIYLLRMLDQIRSGHSQASLTIERWKGRWNYDVQRLVEGCSYEAEAPF